MSIDGKRIVITGGTSGIGAACTRHFCELGAKVVFASNQHDEGRVLQAELVNSGCDATFVFADVADEVSVSQLISEAVTHLGGIDAVHCNAGVWRGGKVTDVTEAEWDLIMGVNVKGVMMTLKHAIPEMEKSGKGVAVVTTSVAAYIGFPNHALYCASKAALEALVRCMAVDYAGVIRTVGICPGTIETSMLAQTAAGWTGPLDELYRDIEQKIPVRRLGQPSDIAKTAAFIISDEASYINGTSIVLDGGTMPLPPW